MRARELIAAAAPEFTTDDLDEFMKGQFRAPSIAEYCSADLHFQDGDLYKFKPDELPLAHFQCQKWADVAMSDGTPLVIIDNTTLTKRERAIYELLARKHGYAVSYEVVGSPDTWDAAELAARSTHEVPERSIRRRIAAFEDPRC